MSTKELIFLGTGAPDATRYFNSCFYIKDGDNGLLVDTGGGNQILSQLEKASIPLEDIKFIYITHKHIDHFLGIFWILRFLGSKISKGESDNLTIFCSQEIASMITEMSSKLLKTKVTDLFGKKIIFEIIAHDKHITINNWKIKCFNIQSKKEEQYGFRLEFLDGITFVNLGDEPYNDYLLSYVKNTDFLLHESFCLDRDQEIFKPHEINHSTVKDAAENATELNVKNLILFHTEDKETFDNRKELYTEEAKKFFNGNIFVPNDLEIITLT